jgi:hypothetical protein
MPGIYFVAPRRCTLTSQAQECAYSSRFIGQMVPHTGGFDRCKAPNIGDLRPSDVRVDQGELALETFPGVPFSAIKWHSFSDVTMQMDYQAKPELRVEHIPL